MRNVDDQLHTFTPTRAASISENSRLFEIDCEEEGSVKSGLQRSHCRTRVERYTHLNGGNLQWRTILKCYESNKIQGEFGVFGRGEEQRCREHSEGGPTELWMRVLGLNTHSERLG